jgi:succinoglycan biosynthesis transport protein ExoP
MQGQAIWRAIRIRGLIVLLATLLGAFVGLGVTASGEESYTASADVFVTATAKQRPSDATEVAEVATLSQQQAINFAGLVTRDVVLLPVIDDLDLKTTSSQLRTHVQATVPLDTSIISISASDPSAERSAQIANALAASLADAVDDLTVLPKSGPPLALRSIEKATAPSSPTTPRPLLNVAIGLLAGLCAGVALVAVGDALRAVETRRTVPSS